jgi:hypothetical protein
MRKKTEDSELPSISMRSEQYHPLGGGVLPKALNLGQASWLVGLSPNKFKELRDSGHFHKPIKYPGMDKSVYASSDVVQDWLNLVEKAQNQGSNGWDGDETL